MSDNNDLRGKIGQAKRRLPLPELMAQVGLGDCAKKSAHCPFHDDQHKSFSMFQGNDGLWHYKCFAGCGDGDEIMFLRKLKGLPLSGAMSLYLEMAGSPPSRPPKSHEYPKRLRFPECRKSPKYHESPVYPMSNGQGLEEELKGLAARNACTHAGDRAPRKRFKLARDLRALEKRNQRALPTAELVGVLDEWYLRSKPFLPDGETRNDHLEKFLAELTKVRVPTGEGETLNKALECISTLQFFELPQIPEKSDAPETCRTSPRAGSRIY
jgi:CHC2 zinc finger